MVENNENDNNIDINEIKGQRTSIEKNKNITSSYFKSPLKKLSQLINIEKISSKKVVIDSDKNLLQKHIVKIKQSSKFYKNLSENPNKEQKHESESDVDSEISDDNLHNIIDDQDQNNVDNAIDSQNMIIREQEDDLFDDYYKKFYMPSSDNVSGYYDLYVTNCIKLLSVFATHDKFNHKISEISKTVQKELSLSNKKLIILDLDETLIHSDLDCKFVAHDKYIETDSGVIPLNIRPNVFEFLDFCSENFDVAVFTASCRDYADPIINFLEKEKKYFKGRFYREHCLVYRNFFLKDMSIFGKPLNDVFIVDNCLFSFAHYLSNGVLITSYYDDNDDLDLLSLVEFFKTLIEVDDVRFLIEETFEFNKIYQNLLNVDI